MNWDAISAVAATLSAVGVIVTLLYLGIQTRLSRMETRHASIDRLVEMWSSHIGTYATNPQLAAAGTKGLEDLGNLDRAELAMVMAQMGRILRVSEAMYVHYRDGSIDHDLWEGIDACLSDIMSQRGSQQYWKLRQRWFSRAFRKYVDSLIDNAEPIDFYPGQTTTSE
jgi:hypothetical protein